MNFVDWIWILPLCQEIPRPGSQISHAPSSVFHPGYTNPAYSHLSLASRTTSLVDLNLDKMSIKSSKWDEDEPDWEVPGHLPPDSGLHSLAVSMVLLFYNPKFFHPTSHHQMEIFSALLALCVGNSPVTGEFLSQKPVRRSFDIFFDLHLNKRLSKQSWGWWVETPSHSL